MECVIERKKGKVKTENFQELNSEWDTESKERMLKQYNKNYSLQ